MIIKQKFRLVSNAPNILSVSSSVIKSYEKEENSPRHVFAVLELKKKTIQHFSNDAIFKLISDTQKRKKIHKDFKGKDWKSIGWDAKISPKIL